MYVHGARFKVSPSEELMRCVAHGILHLAGHRDDQPALRRRMFGIQERALKSLGHIPRLLGRSKGER
jgi:ssRNA-specific RNase YbeY (16S rRNA maturation enzyme)